MKKTLLLLVVMLLPMLLGAVTLADNQKVLGHYITDDLATRGWGKAGAKGVLTIGTTLTPDELALYQGSKIVAMRVGLANSTTISRVFVVPVDGNGNSGDFVEWTCNVSDVGWNLVELATPYEINLPADYSLRIGFDYNQAFSWTAPLSVVDVGTPYSAEFFTADGIWVPSSLNGNLSVQCIVENDNFIPFAIRMRGLTSQARLKIGDNLAFSFQACKLGDVEVPAGACTFEIAIDGNVLGTMTNPQAMDDVYETVNGSISTQGLSAGAHTLTVTAVSVNGEPLEIPVSLSCSFATFENGFTRQMRLVEQFTSTGCTFCPQGTANILSLTQMRNDIAWVSIHENMNNVDPFRTDQTDSITAYQGIDGFPEGTFDRSVGISSATGVYAVITSLSASTMSSFLDYVESLAPAWATVNINSKYDAATRIAHITVNGDLAPGYEGLMGTDSKLTVYITEDGLVAAQTSGGANYVHNNVLRVALGSVKGVDLNKNGDSYKHEFTVEIPEAWTADNLNIVAFVSRPLGNSLTDIYVTNANKRKFGEFDEPTVVLGDMNGDGEINVADVTALIQVILNSVDADLAVADMNGDGEINVADVTVLINLVLNGGV